MQIGPYRIEPRLILAPMAGITDAPMRVLSRRFGAGHAVSEMLASDPSLWQTTKSRHRRDHRGEAGPIAVQIAGSEPSTLADAARFNVDAGADIIDINMGCPAKKVLKAWAGSALLENEALVGRILDAVVRAVDVPVTLKIRTGPCAERRNGARIARIAESAGVAALAVHGRTRADRFEGRAEYATIAAIKQAVAIPVIANGDIRTGADARDVLAQTGADALMIGRAAQGRPWIFREIAAELAGVPVPAAPGSAELAAVICNHIEAVCSLYGDVQGVRIARKHIGWYLAGRPRGEEFRAAINRVETVAAQLELIEAFAATLGGPAGADIREAA